MGLSTFRIAWRNLGRNRKRTVLAVAAIALGQLTLVFVNSMMAGMFDEMLRTITGPLVGHVQVHHREWREERAIDFCVDDISQTVIDIQTLPGVLSVSPRIYSAVLVAPGADTGQPANADTGMVVGLDVEAERRDRGILESLPAGQLPGEGGVVIGKGLSRKLGIGEGDSIAVIGQDADEFPTSNLFEVKAVIRGTTDIVNRMGVLMSLSDAGEFLAMPDQAHEITVHGDDPRKAEALAASIKSLPSLAAAEVLPWRKAVPELIAMMDIKDYIDLIFLAILFVAAAAGIANTMMMSAFERTREFGMLLAMGSKPGRIIWMILIESIVLGLIGVAVGSIIGTTLVLITGHTGIDYAVLSGTSSDGLEMSFQGLNFSYIVYPKFEMRHIIFGVIAVTVTSALASVWPAALAARLEPVEAMRS